MRIAALRLNGWGVAAEWDDMIARGCSERTRAHPRLDAKIMNNRNVVQVRVHKHAESRGGHAADAATCVRLWRWEEEKKN